LSTGTTRRETRKLDPRTSDGCGGGGGESTYLNRYVKPNKMDTGVGIATYPPGYGGSEEMEIKEDDPSEHPVVYDLWQASRYGNMEDVLHVLQKHPLRHSDGINRFNIDKRFGDEKTTALFEAVMRLTTMFVDEAREMMVGIAYILIYNGANPSTYTGRGSTPLHVAVENCPYTLLSIMIEHFPNLNLNVRDSDGRTPLLSCMLHIPHESRDSFMATLLKNGADPSIPDPLGDTLLHQCPSLFILTMVLDGPIPVDINARNNRGETVLHRAVIRQVEYEYVYLLLQMGVDYKIRNRYGKTAGDVELLKHPPSNMISRALQELDNALAIAMATHPRLGDGSRLGTIEPGLMRNIYQMSR
jgi:hypothetical protein